MPAHYVLQTVTDHKAMHILDGKADSFNAKMLHHVLTTLGIEQEYFEESQLWLTDYILAERYLDLRTAS
jgi:hypothetical protein